MVQNTLFHKFDQRGEGFEPLQNVSSAYFISHNVEKKLTFTQMILQA